MRYIARILALLWAGWWTFFGLASGIGEGLPLLGILMHATIPGLIFLFTAIAAWRWETAGGIVMIAVGSLTLVYYPFATTLPSLLTLALPPVVAGALFAWDGWRAGGRSSDVHRLRP